MLTCHKDDAGNNVQDVMIIIVSINMITMAIILTRASSLWHFIRGTGIAEKEGPCLMSTSQPNLVMKIAMTMMTTMLTKIMTMAIKTNLISLLTMSTWLLAAAEGRQSLPAVIKIQSGASQLRLNCHTS